jgi:hypothetical protein
MGLAQQAKSLGADAKEDGHALNNNAVTDTIKQAAIE